MRLHEVQEMIQDTEAAIAETDRAIAANRSPSLLIQSRSLGKRRLELEEEFISGAAAIGKKVCSYRLFDEHHGLKLNGFAASLADFQSMFTSTFDGLKSGPKDRARPSAEAAALSAFDVAYVFAGSLGVVLTLQDDQLLFGTNLLDATIEVISSVVSATEPADVLKHAQKVGASPIRRIYAWARDHAYAATGADVKWFGGNGHELRLLVQPSQFQKTVETIDATSAEVATEITLVGKLVSVSIRNKTFQMEFGDGSFASGSFLDAISDAHVATVPKIYVADLKKTTKIKYSTEEATEIWFMKSI